jgi:large subunit ribosomal protein L24
MSKPKLKIKRDDTVKVISGRDKGAIGRVLKVLPEESRLVVEGVHRVRRHQKRVGDQPGGIITKEAAIHVSNVVLWNNDENRRVKVGYRVEDGKKVRIDRQTGNPLDEA